MTNRTREFTVRGRRRWASENSLHFWRPALRDNTFSRNLAPEPTLPRRDLDSAIYREVLDVDLLDGPALLRRASELSERNGYLDLALACAELAKKLLPDSPEASDTLGWLYLKSQQTQMAVPLFRELVNRAPQVSTYHYHLAMALILGGDAQRGMAQLHSALQYNPTVSERKCIQALIK